MHLQQNHLLNKTAFVERCNLFVLQFEMNTNQNHQFYSIEKVQRKLGSL